MSVAGAVDAIEVVGIVRRVIVLGIVGVVQAVYYEL